MRWAAHVAQTGRRNGYWWEGRNLRGGGVGWIGTSGGLFVNAAMKLRVPYNVGTCMSTRGTVRVARRVRLCGVSGHT
jgi:hypothetical protein